VAKLRRRAAPIAVLFALMLQTPPALAWKNGQPDNKVTNSPADCRVPPWSTHDWIADHARTLLPAGERAWLDAYRTRYLIGTEAPDYAKIRPGCGVPNRGYGDTGNGRHDLRFDAFGDVTRNTPARRAQEEYDKAVTAWRAGDHAVTAYYLGAASHYVADVSQYGHTIAGECHHRDFELWVHARTDAFARGVFEGALKSDGLERRRAYDAVLWVGRQTREGGGAILPAPLMDDLWDDKDAVYENSIAASLNNAVADVLHTFYLDAVAPAR